MTQANTFQHLKSPQVSCIILAGGQGTRLYPLTMNRSKPAVKFGGRYKLIDIPISNALHSNLKNVFVISQYFSSNLNEHIKEAYQFNAFQEGSLHLINPEERPEGKIWYKGTADAVRKNLKELLKHPTDYFLILSGDQLYHMDLQAMVNFARKKKADLTIAALPVKKQEAPRLGLLNIDDDASIINFYEKPKDPEVLERFQISPTFKKKQKIQESSEPCFLASMGIYVFSRDALISLLKKDLREDFGKHLIPTQIKEGKSSVYLHQGYWEDIGTIRSYYQANLSLATSHLTLDLYNEALPIYSQHHHLPGARVDKTIVSESIISEGAIVEAREVTRCIIGIRSTIKEGTIVRDSILIGNERYSQETGKVKKSFTVGKNCHIEKAIIDENVIIGNDVKLLNENNLKNFDGDGVFIRDGIIIITSGTTLPNGFKI